MKSGIRGPAKRGKSCIGEMVISGLVIRAVPGGIVLSQRLSVCPGTFAFGYNC